MNDWGRLLGENMLDQLPALCPGVVANGLPVFAACGVMSIWSSLSSGSKASASSESLLDSANMDMLPTDPAPVVLSPFPIPQEPPRFGESSTMELRCGRFGIIMPFCVMVGEESGEDWSARVEWCRFVHARENSAPRDRRGSTEAGEAYVLRASS